MMAMAICAAAQEKIGAAEPTQKDKTEAIPANLFLKRGAPIGKAKKVSLAKVMQDPSRYAGKTVRVEGVIVRSCKMEGCWAETSSEGECKKCSSKNEGPRVFYSASVRRIICPC